MAVSCFCSGTTTTASTRAEGTLTLLGSIWLLTILATCTMTFPPLRWVAWATLRQSTLAASFSKVMLPRSSA